MKTFKLFSTIILLHITLYADNQQELNKIDTSIPGKYEITYSVTDSFGNQNIKTRIILIQENKEPVITLQGDTTIELTAGTKFVEPGFKATDFEDGDITSKVQIYGTVNTNIPGNYILTYTVSDSLGKSTTKKRTVIVKADEKPEIILKGSQSVNLYVGQTYVDEGVIAKDKEDGDITSKVIVSVEKITEE